MHIHIEDPRIDSKSSGNALLPGQSIGSIPALTKFRFRQSLRKRMAGPGGLYNLGNAIGLFGGVALAVAAAGGDDGPDLKNGIAAVADYLVGGADAIVVSAAMLVFMWGGEVYHRAWANGFPPDPALNRRGDLLSAFGALLLGLGLFLLGQPLLAASSGLLHALGKFGSAVHGPNKAGPERWPDLFRSTVLLSRLPALVLVLTELGSALAAPGGLTAAGFAAPALLLGCYLLWAWADLKLLRST